MKIHTQLLVAASLAIPTPSNAVEIEVTHWWTSGGEAAAVAQFEKAWNATGNRWADSAIWGSNAVAPGIIISRIIGGDPMGATMLQHGRQAEDLIAAGLLLDLTDIAEAGNWKEIMNPPSVLESCTVEGRIYCVPVNIHSPQWMWLSNKAFADASLPTPKNWQEFIEAAPALEDAGIIPLAMGDQPWQSSLAFSVLATTIAGPDVWSSVYVDKDTTIAAGPEFAEVFEAANVARALSEGSGVMEWNDATNLVITGKAAAQIMGDWAQGEFQVAQQDAGVDYECLLGLGVNETISTGGDAFYFPIHDDPSFAVAQKEFAQLLIDPQVQVDFNLAKGSLPIRGDVDLSAANDCMKKGLELLSTGPILPNDTQVLSTVTRTEIADLLIKFWNDTSVSPDDAHVEFVDIISRAD